MSMTRAETLMRAGGRLTTLGRCRRVMEGALAIAGQKRTSPLVADVARVAVAIEPPRTAATLAAESLLDRVAAEWLAAHCRRTWAWAAAFGEVTGVQCDRELLRLAALFHDLGLTTAYAAPPGECFAVTGARVARTWALEAGLDERRTTVLRDAIALHLEVKVALSEGIEAHLLQSGAACDVLGARLSELPPTVVDTVLERFPRGEASAALAAQMEAQAAGAPRTRVGLYCRHFGFARRVAKTALRSRR